jgi:O-antigen ligase
MINSSLLKSNLKNKYQQKIQLVNYYALLLFVFWLPLSDNFIPLAMSLWILTWLLEGNFKSRFQSFPHKKIYIAFLIYFLLTIFSIIYSNNIESGLIEVQQRLSLVLFPIILIGSNQKIKQNIKTILFVFIIGNLVAAIYCLAHSFFTSIVIENNHIFIKYWAFEEFRNVPFFKLIDMRFNVFSYEYLSKLMHPAYFTMYLLFSICILYYYKKDNLFRNTLTIYGIYFIILFFAFIIYLLQSRAGIISMICVFSLILIIEMYKNFKKRYLAIILIIGFILGCIFFSNSFVKKNIDELKELTNIKNKFSFLNSDIRFQAWYTSILVIKDNFWIGTSPADLNTELTNRYINYGFKDAAKEKLNAHNQYLESFAGLGILGFITLISIICLIFRNSIKNKNYLLFFLMVLLSINFLFESIMNRMAGILFMMLFISVLEFSITTNSHPNNLKNIE